jgi:DNA-binding GntR family transcriptional regulator
MLGLTEPIKATSLVNELVERLEHAILVGDLPGGTLLREQTLARSLGVSRGPLREAIRQLEGRMLLQRKPNVGASVVELSLKDLKEIWIMREALEGIACGLAAKNITDEEIAELKRIMKMQEELEEHDHFADSYEESPEFDFHYKIMQASRAQRLVQLICGDLYYLLKVYRYRVSAANPRRPAEALKEHRAILKALVRRDSAEAEAAMRKHLRNSLANMIEASEEAKLDLNAKPATPVSLAPAKSVGRSLPAAATATAAVPAAAAPARAARKSLARS